MMQGEPIRALTPPIGGRPVYGIQRALEWAFATECAQLTIGEEQKGSNFGSEYLLMQRAALGGVQIDTSPGQSRAHEDAEFIADTVLDLADFLGGMWMAIRVAEYARARCGPNAMIGAVPRFEPLSWREGPNCGRGGRMARTEKVETVSYQWRGRTIKRDVMCCPVHLTPSPHRITSLRAHYGDWWWSLRSIYRKLKGHEFKRFTLSGELPPAEPWKNS